MCKLLIQILIILLLFFLGTSEGDKIWNGASSITAVQGESVTMRWMVDLTSIDSSKIWTYAKIIQVEGGRTTDLISLQKSGFKTINDPRYQSRESDLNLNVSQTGATVTIKFTMKNLLRSMDEKHYKSMLGFSSDSSTFPGATSLLIQERPHSTTITASPNQTSYCLNDRITITCVSRAHPSAKYSLYRDNDLVQKEVSSGVFAVSTALTDRVFTCVPYNTVGIGQNRSFQVYVKEPPKILWCKINEANTINRTFLEGSKVTMMCKLSGSEPIDVAWVRINASPPLRWSKRSLTFNAISRKDEGWYRMNASNGKACNTTASATFHVKVQYKPVGTSILVLPYQNTFCINEQIVITCKTEAKPPPEFSLYQNNQLIHKASKSGSFRMFLPVKGEIVLHCVPSNALGRGESKSLRVFVKEPSSITRCKVNNLDKNNITVNEGAKVTFECDFSGSRPLNVTWTKVGPTDVHWNQWNLTIDSVHRNDNGIYKVTVYNGKECNSAVSRTFGLVVNYMSKLQVEGNNFNVFNKSTPLVNFEILTDAYPDLTLTCQSAQLREKSIFVQRIKKGSTKTHFIVTVNTTNVDNNIRLKCTSENEVHSQSTGFVIYKQGVAKIVAGSMRFVGQEWRQDLSDVNSEAHKKIRAKCMKMLYDVYNDIPYVQKWDVLRFTPGSVVMYFRLHVIADVADPLSPLRIAVEKNGGFIGNLQVDPTSIQKTHDADNEGYKQNQTANSTDITIVVLIVIIAVSLIINIVLIVLLLRAKAASKAKSHFYDDPDLSKDNIQQRRNPWQRRSLPAVPNNNNQGAIPLEVLEDPYYEQPCHTQPQASTETEGEKNEAVEVDERNFRTATKDERQNEDEDATEPLKPPIPEVGSESRKEYNKLDPSTKLPPKDSRPALGQGHEVQMVSSSSSDVNNKYQNQEVTKSNTPKTCEALSTRGDENKVQKENSKEYSRLNRAVKQLNKESRPVSTQSYEIPMPFSDTVDHKDQNQKTTQSLCNPQDNRAFAVDEKEPEKTCESIVDKKTDPQLNKSSGESQYVGSINKATA